MVSFNSHLLGVSVKKVERACSLCMHKRPTGVVCSHLKPKVLYFSCATFCSVSLHEFFVFLPYRLLQLWDGPTVPLETKEGSKTWVSEFPSPLRGPQFIATLIRAFLNMCLHSLKLVMVQDLFLTNSDCVYDARRS